MATITAAGYNGLFSLTCPGEGCSPTIVANRLGLILANSTDSSGDYTMNVGAAWYLSIPAVANPSNTVLDISSVYDGSGSPANNSSAPADVSYTLAQADPYVSGWSATRWLVWIANGVGLKVHGETPNATGTEANAAAIMTQAKGCGLYSLLWANDSDMNSGGSWATPAQVITAFNSAYSIPDRDRYSYCPVGGQHGYNRCCGPYFAGAHHCDCLSAQRYDQRLRGLR